MKQRLAWQNTVAPAGQMVPKKAGRLCAARAAVLLLAVYAALTGLFFPLAQAQQYAGEGCVATLENRSTLVGLGGTFSLANIPANPGKYRVRVVCPQPDGTTLGANSDYLDLVPLQTIQLPLLPLGALKPQPNSLILLVTNGKLSAIGATAQLQTQAVLPSGGAYDATLATLGTTYSSSNAAVATVSGDGLVTATGPGAVTITARNDGLVSTLLMNSYAQVDSDNDGMPDAYEVANCLNPFDPSDAAQDPDNDGLTNLQEYRLGTNPRIADTDGDGLSDGYEVQIGTNPLIADTDGDSLSDGDEVRIGTNPLVADTDGDGIPDGVEVKLGLNPLVADATTSVTGHVLNASYTPFAGASVSLLTYFTATTDSTGAFLFAKVPVSLGNLIVAARAVTGTGVLGGSSAATPPVAGGTTDVGTIQLGTASGQVSGTVVDPANRPVALAQVVVTGGNDTRTTSTDSSGAYFVSGLQTGTVAVAVFDPATSLRGQAAGMLTPAGPLTLNVKLGGYGTVSGSVLNTAGTPVGAGVTVTITGALNSTTQTDTLGHYSFAFVPLGTVSLEADDTSGNRGLTSATVTATSQTINANIQYLGRGTVRGVVSDGAGSPVQGAAVSLRNNGSVSQQLTATTDSLGQYSISNVFAGTLSVSAVLASSSRSGTTLVSITKDGQTVVANITLEASGTITGTVTRADGITPVTGATVSVAGTALNATTSSSGAYTLPNVNLGNQQVLVSDTATGDRGYAPANLQTAGATVSANVKLLGFATLKVTVADGAGTPVANVLVNTDTQAPLYVEQNSVTGTDGTATFSQQLAGPVQVTGFNPVTQLAGQASTTLNSGSTAAVTVQLQSYGSIQGTVYRQDAKTPVAGVVVYTDNNNRTTTNASGAYVLQIVPAGTHQVTVTDPYGNYLASNNSVTIASQNQTITANFVIIARGTVTGHVFNPDGTPATNIGVKLISFVSTQTYPLSAATDANGAYTIPNVAVGRYKVTAEAHTTATMSYGTATDTLLADGATQVTDITLSTNLIPATTTFYDANALEYSIRENGALNPGAFGIFSGDSGSNVGGSVLSILSGGTETPFTGEEFGSLDATRRQISLTQAGIAGLNITRRIYVPQDGYFSRYLELIANPGTTDISVGVKLTSNFRNIQKLTQLATIQSLQVDPPHILLTSSGDNLLNVNDPQTPDSWATFGGPVDDDAFLLTARRGDGAVLYNPMPPVADVFSGPGASLKPTSANFQQDSSGNFSTFVYTYPAVRIPAGGTVGILHFVSEENHYASANAVAARLVQLPAEALANLPVTDLATVANFVLPSSGSSTAAPLPALTGQISGFVYGSDGTTPVPGAGVALQSSDPIFSRLYTFGTGSDGSFQVSGNLGGLAIPLEAFRVYATHPLTGIISPTTTANFAAGNNAAGVSVLFSNTGMIVGTVSRGPTVLNVAGTVTLTGSALASALTVPLQANGTFSFTGLLQGSYTLVANVTNTLLQGITSASVTLGSTTTANITIGDSGNVQGTVTRPDGSLAVGVGVNLRSPGRNPLSLATDTSGHYAFTDVPIGAYTVDSYDSTSNASATATVSVAASSTTTQNLALTSAGTVNGTVSVSDGSSVAGLTVTLTSTTSSGTQTLTAGTDNNGRYTLSGVRPGSIAVSTSTGQGLRGYGYGTLPLAGQTVTINIALTASGSVSGTVFEANGTTPSAGVQVTISPAPLSGPASVTTDAAGKYSYALVPVGNFTIYASKTANGDTGQASDSIQVSGQSRVVNVTLTGFGSLTVRVVNTSNSAIAGAAVTVQGNGARYTGTTNASGTAAFPSVRAGNFSVYAQEPVTGLTSSSVGTLAANGSQSITLTLQASGTIQGVVYRPDGTTPAVGASVSASGGLAPVTTAADGSYRFTSVPLGYYRLSVTDSNGYLRATSGTLSLQNNGDIATQNLTFVGVGAVRGTVTQTDGTRLTNATLTVASQNTAVPFSKQTSTGGDGTYALSGLPVGRFSVTVDNLATSLSGFGTSTITGEGDSKTVDIQLVSSSVTLPVTLTDADSFPYIIQADGTYGASGTYGNSLNPFSSTQLLSFLDSNNGTTYFGNGGSPTTAIQSMNGQQIEINQPLIAGLNVTRKIYVPSNGYFSRRLEVLQNTTNVPVTVNVAIQGNERYTTSGVNVVNTSNGNTTVDNTILWAVDDDGVLAPYPGSQPALASVFAGSGAPVGMSAVTFTNSSYRYGNGYLTVGYWKYAYRPITVPANSTASLLFFTAQEAVPGTATGAAQRLVQLPAEALAGLSASDLASVVNFVVPTSPLAAVSAPTTMANLSGHVYAGDGVTPVPNAKVYGLATDLYFGAGSAATADANGSYSLPSFTAANYSATATDTVTQVTSAAATGTVTATAQTQDIPFTGTGILALQIRGLGTTTFASAYIYLTFPCASGVFYCGAVNANIDSTGLLNLLTLPAGNNNIQGGVILPQGGYYQLPPSGGAYTVQVVAGQTTQFTITLPRSGSVTGTVRNADGTPSAGTRVYLSGTGSGTTSETVLTDANGGYTFSSVALGAYTLSAIDPTTGASVSQSTTVTQDVTSTVNLTFVGKGSILVTVHYANGNIGQNAELDISTSTKAAFTNSGYTDGNGQLTIANVPTGAFSIHALYPGRGFYTTTTGNLSSNGQQLQLNITLTPVGAISGKVANSDGTPATGAYVQAQDSVSQFFANAQTDSAGNFAINPVPADRDILVYSNLQNNTTGRTIQARASGQRVPGDGQTLTVNLRYPGLLTVHVVAVKSDGTRYTNGYFAMKSTDGLQSYSMNGAADGSGATFTNVVDSTYVITYNTGYSGFNAGSKTVVLQPSQEGTTVEVSIATSPSATVKGQVFAADGTTPLQGNYCVVLHDVDTNQDNSACPGDANGYQFTNAQVGAGGCTLKAKAGSISSNTVSGTITSEGQVITQNFTVPISAIGGTVFLNDGVTNVPNASVYATQTINGAQTSYYATANNQGVYQLQGPVTGAVTLTAYDSNGITGSRQSTLATDTAVLTGINLTLGPAGTVMGTVYDANGQPLANSSVSVSSRLGTSGNSFSANATTDANGNYTALDIAAGTVTVSAEGTDATGTGVLNNNGDTVVIDVGAPAGRQGSTVFGTVYDSNQAPTSGATVTVTSSANANYTGTATTDSHGVYSVSSVPPGTITAVAHRSDGSATDTVTGVLPDSSTAIEMDLGIQNYGNVSGTVYDGNHRPLGGVDVMLDSTGDPNSSYSEQAGSDGTYLFGSIPAGTVTISVYQHGTNTLIGSVSATLPYGGNVTVDVTTHQGSAGVKQPNLVPAVQGRKPAFTAKLTLDRFLHAAGWAKRDCETYTTALPPLCFVPTGAVVAALRKEELR